MDKENIYAPNLLPVLMCIERKICRYFMKHRPVKELNLVQHYILSEIYRFQGACSSNEIVKATAIDKGTVSKYIQKLASLGYISIVSEETFRRNVELEEKGRQAAKSVFILICRIQHDLLCDLNERELDVLSKFLHFVYNDIYKGEEFHPDDSQWPKFIHYILQVNRNLELMGNTNERKTGIELNQILILLILYDTHGECTFKYLENTLGTAQSCIATQIMKLKEKGMVDSYVSEVDKRVKICKLNREGKKIALVYSKYLMDMELKYCENRIEVLTIMNKILLIVEKMLHSS